MLSIRLTFIFVLLSCAAAAAQEARCPAYHQQHPLIQVDVFDGPPEQLADLVPDVGQGTGDHAYAEWNVAYIFDDGRNVYLVCKYGNQPSKEALTVKVVKRVKRCIYRTHPGSQPAELTCK
jgi:hypothetical protein